MSGNRLRQGTEAREQSSARRLSGRGHSRGPGDFAVVGIGASAGGLDACRKFVEALPAGTGMAFILVQHLDPTHESMMVDLLAGHTAMTVRQATDGMPIEPEHLYVIPPGTYLSVGSGALHLSQPQARHGARLPFDFLLRSLAEEFGERAICVVLSGTGTDGSLGLKTVKEKCGLVIAQDPDEAGYDGMPRNAIMTGAVDLVLPVAEIPEALIKFDRRMALMRSQNGQPPQNWAENWLPEIIDLLRTKTTHDFTLYKPGTLQRRIERRMAMAAIETDDPDRYFDVLRKDTEELDLLAKDLLINVTGFFRDPKVFDFLAETIVSDLVDRQTPDQPLRIWIPGCSTGEETYSLAMLFRERIAAAGRNVKLQVFASDVDPDAVASAREGFYPETIAADVSPARLARFFTKEDHGYRVSPELRSAVVFTVQDVLADPPFSRLDLISCRNLLIYLLPAAQAKVISIFHFALREGGILLLGNSEAIGNAEDRFAVISKSARLYRHIGRSRPGGLGFSMGDGVRPFARPGPGQMPSRQGTLAELCRRLVIDTYAPAVVLINRKYEYLYSLGPTDRYLTVASGHPTNDVLAMAREGVRNKLRSAIQQAIQENARVVVTGGRTKQDGHPRAFSVAVQPVLSEGEELLLVGFIDEPQPEKKSIRSTNPREASRVADLEQELEATRTELQGAIRNLEISTEAQKGIIEETLSVNEEFQATNEELLASKEELQSLNEELTALNSQLQETLEHQRTTANDLQNVLYSTDVATLFLDTGLKIRFFTPATTSLFRVLPSDVGRPLADLSSLAADDALLPDARTVLQTLAPIEREIEAQGGACFIRRILPYRTQDNGVEGVVITFTDITERRHVADALETARQQALQANTAKSRFLAVASHDLRQPLQTLALLQGLLAKIVEGEKAKKLVARLDETLSAITSMLNALLNINQIEAGTVSAKMVDFQVNDLLERLREEFIYHAEAQEIDLRVVPCSLSIHSDPHLLESMIRNLLANALKYTKRGKVLVGCRRHTGRLSIEVWDTGIGIPDDQLEAIFEEYYQLDNSSRQRSRGLGLGLSIVQRLGNVLGHRIGVRSHPGNGSVFSIDGVMLAASASAPPLERQRRDVDDGIDDIVNRTGAILVVEDDPEVSELLELLLKDEGHRVATVPDGVAALELVARGTIQPDIILADYNLPNGMNGLQVTAKLREKLHRQVPVVILTGDISTGILRDISLQNCIRLNKPVKLKKLTQIIQGLLSPSRSAARARAPLPAEPAGRSEAPVIFIVDDDSHIREEICSVFGEDGRTVEAYSTCEAFLEAYRPGGEACLLIDAYMPGMSGLELLQHLSDAGLRLPAIMITGSSDVSMAVQAMKAGAVDFIEKPISFSQILASVERALELSRDSSKLVAWREAAANRVRSLTPRQRQIMELVLAGHPSKNIAADLGISQRTVESHRAAIMKRTGSKSLPALARLALAATEHGTDD